MHAVLKQVFIEQFQNIVYGVADNILFLVAKIDRFWGLDTVRCHQHIHIYSVRCHQHIHIYSVRCHQHIHIYSVRCHQHIHLYSVRCHQHIHLYCVRCHQHIHIFRMMLSIHRIFHAQSDHFSNRKFYFIVILLF